MTRFFIQLVAILFTSVTTAVSLRAEDTAQLVAAKHIIVPELLEVTVWAQTPLFNNPTNMDTDAHGHIWVAEGVNYRRHAERRPEGDRIMVISDTDNDGKADHSHCFVQEPGLKAPLGVSVFGNRIVVAQPPELIVYTDVDNNLKFDPKIDKREVLLSGFNGRHHDHSLHAVTSGPDGKWYINQGNCGAQITDKSGKTFYFGSSYSGGYSEKDWPYNPVQISGKQSDDGFTWIASFIGKINPDGSDLQVLGHNMRNAYEHTVSSFGDIYHSDNDDPPACRNTFLLEGGNAGFSSADGAYSWEAERRPGQDTPTAHWRQQDPGTMPAGDVYGSGSPTGVAFYENGALPEKYSGMFLACDAGRRDIMYYLPRPKGAGMSLDREIFLKTDDSESAFNFRPSDIEVGADGAIYVADWYDPRVGGHADLDDSLSGTIYRIAPKGFKAGVTPDFKTIEGKIALLKSPANNVRFIGFELLKEMGDLALPSVLELMKDKNPYIAARGVWLLPYLGDAGLQECRLLLNSKQTDQAYSAFNALRAANQLSIENIHTFSNRESPQLRRAAASALRTAKYEDKKGALLNLYKKWDGKDRYMLDAIGLACIGDEETLWKSLPNPATNAAAWDEKFAWMTWRLCAPAAIPQLIERACDDNLTVEQRKFAIDTIAFTKIDNAPKIILDLYKRSPEKDYAKMWLNHNLDGKRWDGLIDRDLVAKDAGVVKPGKAIPTVHPDAPESRSIPTLEQVVALIGDPKKGEQVAARCIMCHQIGKVGVNYGPALTGWGATRSKQEILNAVINPDADIAHGFKGHRVHLKNGKFVDGLVKSSPERAWHFVNNKNANPYLIIVTVGGVQQKISWREIKEVKPFPRSLMLYPEQLGLTNAQDLADLTAYLQQLK